MSQLFCLYDPAKQEFHMGQYNGRRDTSFRPILYRTPTCAYKARGHICKKDSVYGHRLECRPVQLRIGWENEDR